MTTFEEKLQEWITNETSFLTEKCLEAIPDVSKLCLLSEGKNKKIWSYIMTHIRSKPAVLKIKRILKLKRDQNDPEKLFPKPVNDLCKLNQEIKNAEDKRNFFKNSVSTVKIEIMSTEETLQNIQQEIDKIHQKTAILHLITLHYQEKTALLSSFNGRLSQHYSECVCKQNPTGIPLSIEASVKKSNLVNFDEINPRVKYLLEQTELLVVKRFRNYPSITSLILNLQKTYLEVFKGFSLYDLVSTLKDQSKVSSLNMIKRLSQNQDTNDTPSKVLRKRDSEKFLQELKFNYINCNFSVKKAKNDICRLMSEKSSLILTKINLFSEDAEYQTKCLLLDKIVENVSMRESISYLEEILGDIQTNISIMKERNTVEIILNEDILTIQNKFYNDFDTMCLLLKSVPSMLDSITQRVMDNNRYASEDLFLTMSSVLEEFPHELKNELEFENETMWNVLKKNEVINPLILGIETLHHPLPKAFWNFVDVAPYKNLIEVCRRIKLTKNYISVSEKDEWAYNEKRISLACTKYDAMINMLEEMENSLNISEENLKNGLSYRPIIQSALEEWWNQSAQFILDIVHENKTLKMWIDIVNAADGVV